MVITIIGLGYGWVYCSRPTKKVSNKKESFSKPVELVESVLLSEAKPEELGIQSNILDEIDQIALNGVKQKAYPGCQVLVAIDGKIIYRKGFGTTTYESSEAIRNDHIYDIASVSKIAASTLAIMRLQTEDKFSLDKKLVDYLPEVVGNTEFANILLRNMMSHRA